MDLRREGGVERQRETHTERETDKEIKREEKTGSWQQMETRRQIICKICHYYCKLILVISEMLLHSHSIFHCHPCLTCERH